MGRGKRQRQRESDVREAYDTPAKLRDAHFIVNPDDPARFHRYGVSDDHPLVRAYERGQLCSGRREYTADDRLGAGMIYRGIWDAVHGSGAAVSNLLRVSGSGQKERAGDRLCVSRDLFNRVNGRMQPDNAFIVQAVCGEGRYCSEAVRVRYHGFEKSIYQAVCLALDDLLDVILRLGIREP